MSGNARSGTIVIGAGLSGMAAALSLARDGRDVTLVEALDDVGGCCSTVLDQGFTFNNGAVYIAVPSLLRSAFERLGLDFDSEVATVPIPRPQLTFTEGGSVVHLSDAVNSRVEGNAAKRSTERLRSGLYAFQRDWGPIYRALVSDVLPRPPSNWQALRRLWRYLPTLRGTAASSIARYFPDEDIQAAVAATVLYTGISPERLPASQLIGLAALLEEGFHLPVGGMGSIASVLESALQRHGVQIHRNTVVDRILVRGGEVRGVSLRGGGQIGATRVVASCSGFELVSRLLDRSSLPRTLATRAAKAPLSHRAVSIQLGVTGGTLPDAFIVNHVPQMQQQGAMHTFSRAIPEWFSYTQPTSVVPGSAPMGKSVLEMFAPATGVRHASEWSKEMTHEVVDNYIQAFRRRVPDVRIETLRVLDPGDFQQRRMLYEGALYGVAPGSPPGRLFPHDTGIFGLFLCGQTTFPGYGLGPALFSGIHAASASHALRER